jgi:hypothetical protein
MTLDFPHAQIIYNNYCRGNIMLNRKFIGRLIAGVAIVALAPLTVVAQDDGPGYLQVRTMVVKTDKVPEFMELQAEFAEAAKAAGMSRQFWSEVRGNGNTYHSVSPLNKLADIDEEFQPPMESEAWQKWIAGFSAAVASTTFQVLQVQPGWNIPAAEGADNPFMLLRTTTVAPGSSGARRAWIENDLIPAIREGGFQGFSVSRVRMGGNPDTWMSATRHPNWAAMEAPGFFSYMSDEDRNTMFENNKSTNVSSDIKILRLRADLSY